MDYKKKYLKYKNKYIQLKNQLGGTIKEELVKNGILIVPDPLPDDFDSYELINKTIKSLGLGERSGIDYGRLFEEQEVTDYIIKNHRHNLLFKKIEQELSLDEPTWVRFLTRFDELSRYYQ
jgi:hypothetical protein